MDSIIEIIQLGNLGTNALLMIACYLLIKHIDRREVHHTDVVEKLVKERDMWSKEALECYKKDRDQIKASTP